MSSLVPLPKDISCFLVSKSELQYGFRIKSRPAVERVRVEKVRVERSYNLKILWQRKVSTVILLSNDLPGRLFISSDPRGDAY